MTVKQLKYFIPVFLVLGQTLWSQIKVSGTITDSKTKKPISYADINLPEGSAFTMSNSDGTFYLESKDSANILEISKEGYDTQTITLGKKVVYDLQVNLVLSASPSNGNNNEDNQIIELEGATVTNKKKKYKNKKENPAYAILRELWARKRHNGLTTVPEYAYQEYEKLEFDFNNIDSAFMKKKLFKGMEFIFDKIDTSNVTGKAYLPGFLNESIYKVYGQNKPSKKFRKDLVANKNSGFENNEIVIQTIKNMYKEYDIYDNRLNFFNLNFVSPVARDGFSVYEYELIDTVNIDGLDCYHIKYYPKSEGQLTFKGDMYIGKTSYSLEEVEMETTKDINVNFVRSIYVSLQFHIENDSVFYPTREYVLLDMTLLNKKSKAKGMYAQRTVNYSDIDLNAHQDDAFYKERFDPYKVDAYNKADDYWAENRPVALNKNEEGIYETLAQLQKVPKFNRIVKIVETLGSGYINVWKSIDIGDLYSTFGFNEIEGLRLRAGARTYFTPNDLWRVGGYTAYGFKDKQFKYGIEARTLLNKYNRFQVGFGTKRDIEQLGVQLTMSDGIMTRSFASSAIISQGGANNKLSHINKTNFYTAIDPWKNITFRYDFTYQTTRSADPEQFNIDYLKNGNLQSNLVDSRMSLSIIARPGALYSRYGIDRWEHSTLAPTIMLRYTHGFAGLFNGDFNYDKLQFLFSKPFLIGSLGRSNVTIEAGKTFQGLPLSLLSVIPGNESFSQVPGTFTQLDYYEFVTDTYSTFSLEHHFNGYIFSKIPLLKKLKLREVGFVRAAWGDISSESLAMNRSEINYTAPKDKIYVEYGFGIENIGFGNFRLLRIDFNWRGNYLNMPDIRKFGITFGLNYNW